MESAHRRFFTRGLLVFWALWFSVVLASNAADALRELSWLPPTWSFTSGNFALLADSFAGVSLSSGWAGAAFALVLVLELLAAILFWRAACVPRPLGAPASASILRPFLVSAGLFGGFLVFDEILLIYRRIPSIETTHFVILCALLLSLLLIQRFQEVPPGT